MSFNTARIHFKRTLVDVTTTLACRPKKTTWQVSGRKIDHRKWHLVLSARFLVLDDALSLLNLPNTSRVRWERETETEHSFSLLSPRWNYQGKEELLQCAGLIFEAICNEYFGLGLFRSVVDLKSKISDRNNMAFYFCLRDFLSAIFMYHSVVTNSYSSSKPILQQES